MEALSFRFGLLDTIEAFHSTSVLLTSGFLLIDYLFWGRRDRTLLGIVSLVLLLVTGTTSYAVFTTPFWWSEPGRIRDRERFAGHRCWNLQSRKPEPTWFAESVTQTIGERKHP